MDRDISRCGQLLRWWIELGTHTTRPLDVAEEEKGSTCAECVSYFPVL